MNRLVYAPADEFDRWHCRPLGTIDVLDLLLRMLLGGVVDEDIEAA